MFQLAKKIVLCEIVSVAATLKTSKVTRVQPIIRRFKKCDITSLYEKQLSNLSSFELSNEEHPSYRTYLNRMHAGSYPRNSNKSSLSWLHWSFASSIEVAALIRCGTEGAELKVEAFDLLVQLCSYPHLRACDLGNNEMNETPGTSGWNEFPFEDGLAQPWK